MPGPDLPLVEAYAPAPLRPESFEGLSVWTSGDSTSYYMSVAAQRILREQGATLTQVLPEYKISTGLLNPGFFNWPEYLEQEMARAQPNLVVLMLGANDAAGIGSGEVFRRRVGELMDQLRAAGRLVVWVGQPNMGPQPARPPGEAAAAQRHLP